MNTAPGSPTFAPLPQHIYGQSDAARLRFESEVEIWCRNNSPHQYVQALLSIIDRERAARLAAEKAGS